MPSSHKNWLQQEGVSLISERYITRPQLLRNVNYIYNNNDTVEMTVEKNTVYKVEITDAQISKWKYYEEQYNYIMSAHIREPGIHNFFAKNQNRHRELLAENSMYREAWVEFQSIRALLGEDTHWP